MRRETWSLVALKHPVAKSVIFRHREIRLHVRSLYIHVLRVWWSAVVSAVLACDLDLIRAVHQAVIPGGEKCVMAVTQVDRLIVRVQPAAGDVGDSANQHWIVE